jgi:mRNA interferase RelE/StbE
VAYGVFAAPAFKHDLKKLERKVQKRIFTALDALADEPRPRTVEKLTANPKFYRVPVGDYRIVYFVDDPKSIIVLCLVRNRKDVYRDVAKLNITAIFQTLKPLLVSSPTASN